MSILVTLSKYFQQQPSQDPLAQTLYPEVVAATSSDVVEAVRMALVKGVVTPNLLLWFAVTDVTDSIRLLFAGMAVRQGANPNYYHYDDVTKKDTHILCHVIHSVADAGLRHAVVAMLVRCGSRFSDAAVKGSEQTVFQWIQDKVERTGIVNAAGVTLEADDMSFYRALTPQINIGLDGDTRAYIGLALDDSSIVVATDTTTSVAQWATLAVQWRAIEVLKALAAAETPTVALLNLAIDCYDADIVNYLIDSYGLIPNYITINHMLLLAKRQYQKQHYAPYLAMVKIVELCIYYGVPLDVDQMLIAKSTHSLMAERIKKEYQVPFWVKECRSHRTPVTSRLRELALALHARHDSKEEMCTDIARSATGNHAALTQQVVEHRKKVIATTYESIHSAEPAKCQVLVDDHINQYADWDVVSYRDTDGKVWCFRRDNIDSLLHDGTNAITGAPLPEEFMIRLRAQKQLLTVMGVDTDIPVPISKVLETINQKDTITPDDSLKRCREFEKYLQIKGVSVEGVRNIDKAKLEDIVQPLVVEPLYLTELTQRHAYMTFCRVARWLIDEQVVDDDVILRELKMHAV